MHIDLFMNSTSSESRKNNVSLEEIFSDAETRLRSGMEQLGEWSNQISRLIENRPGSLVAGIAVAGFLTGLVMRNGTQRSSKVEGLATSEASGFAADPIITFLTGAVTGFTVGPKLVDSARMGARRSEAKSRLASIDRH